MFIIQDAIIDAVIYLGELSWSDRVKLIQVILLLSVVWKEREEIWLVYWLLFSIWIEVVLLGRYEESSLVSFMISEREIGLIWLLLLLYVWILREGKLEIWLKIIILMSIGAFSVGNILGFYIYFEGVLFPMYLILLRRGKSERRKKAGKYLVLYTIGGSILMLGGILSLQAGGGVSDVLISLLKWEWISISIGMIVKIPVLGLHVWLGEAHVEASTEGLMLLAGILLKLGTYGLWKYNIVRTEWTEGIRLIEVLGVLGMLYTGLSAIRNMDMKRVIAYGSIGHMSMLILGMSTGSINGVDGGIIQMIGHGVVSSGLFYLIGAVYYRTGSREILRISGISELYPYLSILLLLLMLGNIGIPLSLLFIGELLLLKGIWELNSLIGVTVVIGLFLGSIYLLYMLNRILLGGVRDTVGVSLDLSREYRIKSATMIGLMFLIGIKPEILL